ncbi:MAG: serine/threonine protein kinase [Myxococcales bacterium]|nr:serine/threonine protein kinase [Myxococcales bacterium]
MLTELRGSPPVPTTDLATLVPDGVGPRGRQAQVTEADPLQAGDTGRASSDPVHSVTAPPGLEGPNPDVLLAVQPPPSRDLSGTLLLDRYRLIKRLGEGGMGTVYLAEHVTIKKRCAIKLLNPEYAHKEDLVERFLQEARAASMIAHENVVEITDFGAAPNGSVFFVMEMLTGEDLGETIKREAPLPWSRVAPMAMQICRALAAAHDKGIVHRDMKPENCFRIERSGNPDFIKVLDFGIAKVTSEDPDGNAARLTSTGMIFGTPTYMSPEQAQGMRVDHRSDIYAVGVILYELITGRPPFYADNFMGILTKHMFDAPHAPSEVAPMAGISPEVEALVLKALQKEREFRFQSMQEMMAAITAIGTGAAPVAVVSEVRSRPSQDGKPIEFNRRSTGPIGPASGEVTLSEPPPAPQRRYRTGALVLSCAILGASVAMLVMALGGGGDVPPPALPDPTPSTVSTPPQVVGPVDRPLHDNPTPQLPPPQPQPTEIRVFVTSNVPAEIFDPSEARSLGATGDAGIVLTAGTQPRKVVVRASGYEDVPLELTATAGERYTADLRPKKKTPGKNPTPTRTDGKGPDGKKPPDTKQPDTKQPDTKSNPFGLKNPFETRTGG